MLKLRSYASRRLIVILAAFALIAALFPLYAYAEPEDTGASDSSVDLPLDSAEGTVTVPDTENTNGEQNGDSDNAGSSTEDVEGGSAQGDQSDAQNTEGNQTQQMDERLQAAAKSSLSITIPLTVDLKNDGSGTLKLSQPVPSMLEGRGSFFNNSNSTVYISSVECFKNNINTIFTGTPTLLMTPVADTSVIDTASDTTNVPNASDATDTSNTIDTADTADTLDAPDVSNITWQSQNNKTGQIYADDQTKPVALFQMKAGQLLNVNWQLGLEGSSFNLEELAQAGLDTSKQMLGLSWTFERLEG